MGACPSHPVERPTTKITVYGDHFSAETRTIINVLEICSLEYDFQHIDQLKGEHKKEPYFKINPSGYLPTITHGGYKVIGNFMNFYMFLCNTYIEVKEQLYSNEAKLHIER